MLKITGKLKPSARLGFASGINLPVILSIIYLLPKSVYYFSSYLLRKVTFPSYSASPRASIYMWFWAFFIFPPVVSNVLFFLQHFDVEHWKLVLYLCTREDRAVKPKFWPGIWTFQSRPDFCPKFWREFWKMSFFANSQYWTIKSTLTFDHSVNFCNLANDWNFVWKFCAQSWSEFCLDLETIFFSQKLVLQHFSVENWPELCSEFG